MIPVDFIVELRHPISAQVAPNDIDNGTPVNVYIVPVAEPVQLSTEQTASIVAEANQGR